MFNDAQFKAWVEKLPAKLPDDVFTLQQVADLNELTTQELLFVLAVNGANDVLQLYLIKSKKSGRLFRKRHGILAANLPAIAEMVRMHRELHRLDDSSLLYED